MSRLRGERSYVSLGFGMNQGIQSGDLVCVTGAGGYIGTHVVRVLLERGYRVRGTVRDPADRSKNGHLASMAQDLGGDLELVAADLLEVGSFDEAVKDCSYVCHVASVVKLKSDDPQREIIDPAVRGTKSVLESVDRAGVARRVVITSSISAIVDDSRPYEHTFDEGDWNESSTVEDAPYPRAKSLAERAAWAHVQPHTSDAGYDLVTINPTMVLGPVLAEIHTRSSPQLIRELVSGKFPLIPHMHFGVVDVRDVALAHAIALENPAVAGRHILNNRGAWFAELGAILREVYPRGKTPKYGMPTLLMYAVAMFDKRITLSFVRRAGKIRKLDNSKSRDSLGIEYRDLRDTLRDTAKSFAELGLV